MPKKGKTMEIRKAIEILICERTCVKRQDTPDCNRDECGCQNCDLIQETEDVIEAYNMAIEALAEKEDEPDTGDRDCKNCIHHLEGGCESWNCEFERRPTEDAPVISKEKTDAEEAAEEAIKEAHYLGDDDDTIAGRWHS